MLLVEVDDLLPARVGGDVVSVVGVVDQPVVVYTQGDGEVEVGEPAFGPWVSVMQL